MTVQVAVADTSALLAVFNRKDDEHEACVRARSDVAHLVISPLVLAELDYLVTTRIGVTAAVAIVDHVRDRIDARKYEVPDVSPHLGAAGLLMTSYASMRIGLTDAMNAVLAAQLNTDAILTLDRAHFRAIRPMTGHECFRLLPDDL